MKFNGRKILRITLITLLSLITFLVILVMSLRIPAVQNFIKDKLVVYLEDKIHTKVRLDRVYVDFPNSIVMENLYLAGQDVDTLLYVHKFDVGLHLPKLLQSKVDITSIDLDGTRANVVRKKEGTFNFDYIIDAFATKDAEQSESKPFIISLNKIKLRDIGVSFSDQMAGNNLKLHFNDFSTKVKTFDLQKNSYAIDDIALDGLKLRLKQDLLEEISTKVEEKVDSLNQKKAMKLSLQGIKLTNFDIDYGDERSKTFALVNFKELSTKISSLDLDSNSYSVDFLNLKGARVNANLFLNSTKKPESKAETPPSENTPLNFSLTKLKLDDVAVVYNNTAVKPIARGMDYNHLAFSKLNVDMEGFKMENGTFVGKINAAEIKEKRGLDIQKLKTEFAYTDTNAHLKNLYLQTPQTILRDELNLDYNSVQQLSENLGAVKLNANLRNSRVGFKDVLLFAPDLRATTPFNTYPNAVLDVDARVKGTVNDLLVQNLQVSGLGDLKIAASGKIKNATNPAKLYFDVLVKDLSTSSKTLYKLLPKNTVPSTITLPNKMVLKGALKGTISNIHTNINLATSLGNAKVKADVDMRQKNKEAYTILADVNKLQIGKIIQQKDVGSATGTFSIKGKSFDFNQMDAVVIGDVKSFGYQNYTYSNVKLNAKVKRKSYEVKVNSLDPNANLNLYAAGNLNENKPNIKAQGTIVKLDLQKLGFYAKPMIIAGKLDGDFSSLNPDALNGYLNLEDVAFSDEKEVFPVQKVQLLASSTAEENSLQLKSQVLDVDLNGKYKLTQIIGSLQQTVNEYYQFQKSGKKQKVDAGQYFTFNALLKDDDLIRKFVPELKSFETITLVGNYDADTQKLNVNGEIPQLLYGENQVEGAKLSISNQENSLAYLVEVGSVKNDNFSLNKVNLNGTVEENTIAYNLTTKDEKDATQFLVAGTAKSIADLTEISLNADGLKLNYSDWTVNPENKIQITKNGIIADNFILSNNGSQLVLQSETLKAGAPLNIQLKDFKIESLTEIIKTDSLLAKGVINGTAQIRDLQKNMTFTSDLTASDVFVFGNPVGKIDAKVSSATPGVMNANILLSENNNDVRIDGVYRTTNSSFNLDLDVNRLEMKTLQGFTMNAIANTEGYLSGNLKLSGTTDAPSIVGKLKFNDAGLLIAKTGSDFRKINDAIDFTSRGIEFNRFKINDADGNSLIVNGQVLTKTYRDFAFNLNVNANDFLVVNSEQNNDAMMYGKLAIDAALRIRGDLELPKVDGRLSVTDKTNFTFVIPQTAPTLQEREGIVEFIDQDQPVLMKTIKADSIATASKIKGMDVNLNIEVNKEAKLSIIIDKSNGDFVELQGEAELTGGIDPSGKTTLVGVYEVEKGAYELSVSLVKRRFDIEKGSTITWTGEPLTADLNLTAVYKTSAAPIDLLQQQLAGMSSSELNMYKQRIPFNTLLKLRGELMKPEISFQITSDEDNVSVASSVMDNVKTKLNQLDTDEAERNKQVFALLLLNRFIGENPFQSEAGMSAGTIARQSVSSILSQQLNNLASDLISGVDLNFGFDTVDDYSSGEKNTRTDVNIDISKKLLNDRLKVSIGSNFGLEGDARKNEQMNNIAGDITVDYSLSKDGRYMLRAYRKNEYQVALQGQIVETGLGFIITLDYDKFKEIFQKQKNKREQRRTFNIAR